MFMCGQFYVCPLIVVNTLYITIKNCQLYEVFYTIFSDEYLIMKEMSK